MNVGNDPMIFHERHLNARSKPVAASRCNRGADGVGHLLMKAGTDFMGIWCLFRGSTMKGLRSSWFRLITVLNRRGSLKGSQARWQKRWLAIIKAVGTNSGSDKTTGERLETDGRALRVGGIHRPLQAQACLATVPFAYANRSHFAGLRRRPSATGLPQRRSSSSTLLPRAKSETLCTLGSFVPGGPKLVPGFAEQLGADLVPSAVAGRRRSSVRPAERSPAAAAKAIAKEPPGGRESPARAKRRGSRGPRPAPRRASQDLSPKTPPSEPGLPRRISLHPPPTGGQHAPAQALRRWTLPCMSAKDTSEAKLRRHSTTRLVKGRWAGVTSPSQSSEGSSIKVTHPFRAKGRRRSASEAGSGAAGPPVAEPRRASSDVVESPDRAAPKLGFAERLRTKSAQAEGGRAAAGGPLPEAELTAKLERLRTEVRERDALLDQEGGALAGEGSARGEMANRPGASAPARMPSAGATGAPLRLQRSSSFAEFGLHEKKRSARGARKRSLSADDLRSKATGPAQSGFADAGDDSGLPRSVSEPCPAGGADKQTVACSKVKNSATFSEFGLVLRQDSTSPKPNRKAMSALSLCSPSLERQPSASSDSRFDASPSLACSLAEDGSGVKRSATYTVFEIAQGKPSMSPKRRLGRRSFATSPTLLQSGPTSLKSESATSLTSQSSPSLKSEEFQAEPGASEPTPTTPTAKRSKKRDSSEPMSPKAAKTRSASVFGMHRRGSTPPKSKRSMSVFGGPDDGSMSPKSRRSMSVFGGPDDGSMSPKSRRSMSVFGGPDDGSMSPKSRRSMSVFGGPDDGSMSPKSRRSMSVFGGPDGDSLSPKSRRSMSVFGGPDGGSMSPKSRRSMSVFGGPDGDSMPPKSRRSMSVFGDHRSNSLSPKSTVCLVMLAHPHYAPASVPALTCAYACVYAPALCQFLCLHFPPCCPLKAPHPSASDSSYLRIDSHPPVWPHVPHTAAALPAPQSPVPCQCSWQWAILTVTLSIPFPIPKMPVPLPCLYPNLYPCQWCTYASAHTHFYAHDHNSGSTVHWSGQCLCSVQSVRCNVERSV